MPTSLELGLIDYRETVTIAVRSGFQGVICTEHYGGDGLSVSATNREYLRRVLPRQEMCRESAACVSTPSRGVGMTRISSEPEAFVDDALARLRRCVPA